MKEFPFFLSIFLLLIILLYNGCKQTDVSKNYSRDTYSEKVSGTIDGGVFLPSPTEVKGAKQIIFTEIGQSYKIEENQSVTFVFDGISLQDVMIVAAVDELTGEITFTLNYKEQPIRITKKCETFLVHNLQEIPLIEVDKDLKPEQIIITPIFNNYCNLIGYQIRYGSIERGCKDASTKKIFGTFNKCTGKSVKRNLNSFREALGF